MSLGNSFEREACNRRERYDSQREDVARNFELEQQRRRQREQAAAAALQPLLAKAVREAAREIAPLLPVESANVVLNHTETEEVIRRNRGFSRLTSGRYSAVSAVRHSSSPGWIIRESRTQVRASSYDHKREDTLWWVQESGLVVNQEGGVLAYREERVNWTTPPGPSGPTVRLSHYRTATDAEIAAKPSSEAEWHDALLNLIPTKSSTSGPSDTGTK